MKIKFENQEQNAKNINGGVMTIGEILVEFSGELVYEECTKEELEIIKKYKVGYLLELEQYKGIKFKIVKEGILCGENSIKFKIEARYIN